MPAEINELSSCLTDNPVRSVNADKLSAQDYARALARFIRKASTPVTIGIQGGWGSGKTSLITMLDELLSVRKSADPSAKQAIKDPVLCVTVNAWEHSLFQHDDRAEVALSLLSALTEGVRESAEKADWIDKDSRKLIDANSEAVEKAIGGLKVGLKFAGKMAAQMVSNMVGGGDISNVKLDEASKNVATLSRMAASVRGLKKSLQDMIDQLKYQGQPVKVVFFIDDLDRVPPATAIEILDTTKNIFDIPQCVFVLAIDYEVVVKGLESKFGQRSIKNEREFRQYFDKIIQIPFSMPLGAYGDKLTNMLRAGLQELGYEHVEADNEQLAKLAQDAKLATAGIPRSIKRILNTLSLLQHIADVKQKRPQTDNAQSLPPDLETRFIVVALHINFPEICSRVMEFPDFTQWTPEALDAPWRLNLAENQPELDLRASQHLFNDPWEKVIYCLCAESPWLKTMSASVSRLMNNLLVSLGGDEDNATFLPEQGLAKLKSILSGISVVTIDAAASGKAGFDPSDIEKNAQAFFGKLQDALAQRLAGERLPRSTTEQIEQRENGDLVYTFQPGRGIPYIEFSYRPDDPDHNNLCITVGANRSAGWVKAQPIVEEIAKRAWGKNYWTDRDGRESYYIGTGYPFTEKDFTDSNISRYAEAAAKMYNVARETQKGLENI